MAKKVPGLLLEGLARLQNLAAKNGFELFSVDIAGCAFGMKDPETGEAQLKEWRIWATDPDFRRTSDAAR